MLPLKKVVLFKHGVGHFEREGQISGDTSLDLHFRTSEMNDVLKSLTVLDLDGGLITSISYDSTLSLADQLREIAIELPNTEVMSGLWSQLQGAQVAVEIGPNTVTGLVMGTQILKHAWGKKERESFHLSLLVNGNTLQSFDFMEIKQLTLLDENLTQDIQHLLAVLINTKKPDLKKLTVFFKGKGERTINLSYIIEAPIWKTSYRLLLNENSPLIQGWALVDNTQDEDWENVNLSLVAGLPVSFTHDLYSPRYQPRPVVQVKTELAYAPPLSEPAVETYQGLADEDLLLDDLEDAELLDDLGDYSLELDLSSDREPPLRKRAIKPAALEHSIPIHTRTVAVGDLFQYQISHPVTVKRQQSALVPILQTHFSGKRVAIYNRELCAHHPMSAVLFHNTTDLTLEQGPLTVFEHETYLGEAMLNTLTPGAEQLVPFSVELGCVISIEPHSDQQEVHQARIRYSNLYLHYYEEELKTYVIQNKTERDLDLFIEHRFNPGWELIDTPEPIERTTHFYRFRVEVPSTSRQRFTVTEGIERKTIYALRNTSRDQLKLWLEKKYIDKKTLRLLEGISNLLEQINQFQLEINLIEQDLNTIFKNQERLRQNLQVLGSTQEERSLRERYLTALAAEEDKLAQYQIDIQSLRTQKDTCEKNLQAQLSSIELNVKL